jgi:hypothetical protein
MGKVRRFVAHVAYTGSDGGAREDSFPIYTHDFQVAKSMALSYALAVLKLGDFELRLVGA